jgi:hypothetical protein
MITIAAVIAVIAFGAMAGAIVMVRAGIGRDEAHSSLMRMPATRASAMTRRIVDFKTQIPQR